MKTWGLILIAITSSSLQAGGRSYGHDGHGYQHYDKVLVLHQVGSALREEAIAEKAVEKAIPKMREELQKHYEGQIQALRQELQAAISGKICVEFGGVNIGKASTESEPAAADAPSNPSDAAAQRVIDRNCLRCHNGPNSKGKSDFRDVSKLSELMKRKIQFAADSELMPPKGQGQPVNDADNQILHDWIKDLGP